MRLLFTTSMTALLVLSGCASIDAGEEVKGLQGATSTFAEALRAADAEEKASSESVQREIYRSAVTDGGSISFAVKCLTETETALRAYQMAVEREPYDWRAVDQAYGGMSKITPCDLVPLAPGRLRTAVTLGPPLDFGGYIASGDPTLSGTADKLEAYVNALADVATGETAGKADTARGRLVDAGKDLLGNFQIANSGVIVDAAAALVNSIIAAKRNAATRKFLDKMDPYMPAMMERTGLAARFQQAAAVKNRATVANSIARGANKHLRGDGLKPGERARYLTSQERLARYDQAVSLLEIHNGAMVKLASSDPMIAARAFAVAHRSLREIYHDPKANQKAIMEGLESFQEAAIALYKALKKTPGGAEAS
jgi:hypothetical protein